MTLELTKAGSIGAQAAADVWSASGQVTLPSGKALKIETSPDGEELLVLDAVDHDRTIQLSITVIDPT